MEGFAAKLYAFGAMRSQLVGDFHNMAAEEVLNRFSVGSVLDVGTGPGYLPIKIAFRNQLLRMVGLDLAEDMIKIAQRNVERAGLENVGLLVGSVIGIGMTDESLDLAVATMSFHHWAEPIRGLAELHRILKHGGEVWIYELDGHPTPQSEAWMKKNYNMIQRMVIRMERRHSSITVEHAEEILASLNNKFKQYKVEQLEPPIIKMTLIKS